MIVVMVGSWAFVIGGLALAVRRGAYLVRRDRRAAHAALTDQLNRGEIDDAEFKRLDEMLPTPR